MSLKIALLTNYPQVDNVEWKRKFVEKCVSNKHKIDVFYGKKGFKSLFLSYLKKRKFSNSVAKKGFSKSQKNKPFFKQNQIAVYSFKNLNHSNAIETIKSKKYDIIVVALDQLLSKKFITSLNTKIINIHYGSLPEIKGTSALEWTYINFKTCELTLHYIDSGIDTGAIITKKQLQIEKPINFLDLRTKVQIEIPSILEAYLKKLENKQEISLTNNSSGRLHTFMHPELVKIIETNS